MKRGIKEFVDALMDAVNKEMKQLNDFGVLIPVDPHNLSSGSKAAVLKYLMFLNMKQDVRVKGRGYTDGRYQRAYTHKDESISTTVATKSLMISCVIDAVEQRAVSNVDIPGAFLQADMDKLVCIKFEGLMAELLSKIDPKFYEKYMVIERGHTVLYASIAHPLHGTLQVSLLLWRKLTGILAENGYNINPYDRCVYNKGVNGSQCTVLWHVGDLKLSHLTDNVITAEVKNMNKVFSRKDAPLNVCCGKIHDYLGMNLD